jgi:hypothetical protein
MLKRPLTLTERPDSNEDVSGSISCLNSLEIPDSEDEAFAAFEVLPAAAAAAALKGRFWPCCSMRADVSFLLFLVFIMILRQLLLLLLPLLRC